MVNLNTGSHVTLDVATSGLANSALSSQSLSDQLSQAFSATLQEFGIDPSSIKLTIQSNSGQTNGTSQNPVTPAASTTPAQPTTATPVQSLTQHWYASDPVDDAYWSKQPAAVQQLREIQDMSQRQTLGAQLAAQGYQIDNAVMIWGWDAGATTALRQSMGYTWIPAANQPNISAAPGITGPGITPYDPNHPPAGSIAV